MRVSFFPLTPPAIVPHGKGPASGPIQGPGSEKKPGPLRGPAGKPRYEGGWPSRCRYFFAAALFSISSMKTGSTPYPRLLAFLRSATAWSYFSCFSLIMPRW